MPFAGAFYFYGVLFSHNVATSAPQNNLGFYAFFRFGKVSGQGVAPMAFPGLFYAVG